MITIKIPVYITLGSKTHFLSMNAYRNWHYFTSNKIKQLVESEIASQLPYNTTLTQYKISYTYNYKSKVSDLPNVCALASKYLNDAIKANNIILDDNIQFLKSETYLVGVQSKDDPHILATISEYHDTTAPTQQ